MIELAESSTERQTKVAACELLHSLVLYMLGRSAQQPGTTQAREPMDGLYRKVFPAVLTLACDVEQVCYQIFQFLVFFYFFDNYSIYESHESFLFASTLPTVITSFIKCTLFRRTRIPRCPGWDIGGKSPVFCILSSRNWHVFFHKSKLKTALLFELEAFNVFILSHYISEFVWPRKVKRCRSIFWNVSLNASLQQTFN